MARRRRGRVAGIVYWTVALLVVAGLVGGGVWLWVGTETGPAQTVTCRVTDKGWDEEGVGWIETTSCGSLTVPSRAVWEEDQLDDLDNGRTYRFRVEEIRRPFGLSETRVVEFQGEVTR